MNQKVSLHLSQNLLQGYDLQMVQNVHLYPGALFADFVEEYCRETPSLRLIKHAGQSYDIDYSLLAKEESLYDHLSFQIETGFLLEEKREAFEIASSLDRNGFYQGEDTPVLQKMQRLDPVGIAAISPQKAMLVQLQDKEREYSLAFTILRDHYSLFLKNNEAALSKKLELPQSLVQGALQEITALNPFPGRAYAASHVKYVLPEMKLSFDKKWHLSFVKEFYPACEIVKGEEGLSRAKKFIYQLHQRKNRLEWIVSKIVKKQDTFLRGFGEKECLYRSDLLKEIGISESMLSRILSEKYIETPVGIFPLGYFFTRKTKGMDADSSVEKAKKILKALVDQENKEKPLGDQSLAEMLKEEGVLCSRRSVAKYRKSLNIPSVYHRATFK